GASTACTRQCAGSTTGGAPSGPCPRPPAPPRPAAFGAGAATGPPGGPPCAGGVNGPAGTSCAEVIVVFGSASDAIFSHDVASPAALSIMTVSRLNMCPYIHPVMTTVNADISLQRPMRTHSAGLTVALFILLL